MAAAARPSLSEAPVAPPARGRDLFLPLALLGVLGALVRAIWFTPVELMQGPAQKIFYVHVPAATVGLYVGLPIVAVCSAMYLWLRDERLDRVAESAAEVSLVFLTAVLVTGPLWGKPVWGTWWTWDARLTLTLFLWFVVLGYLIMRGALEDRGQRARFSAVLGLLAVLLVPFIHLSVNLFRTLHPKAIVLKPSAPSLPPEMLSTLGIAFAATVVLFFALLRARVRYAADRELLSRRLEGEG
ncbi:cytochrome c biogenesis protein CcsA [Roseisolibacter sp. H3M3-2]|uniref:cytochrome c biogenesis protein CcsA n=1 Tax=Roseisolibacter sp. H3M3-2 TaxID=3031323 RepID=UPI0023DAE803|nr:cytochrome c biogenesis protein CcsA [Roseisolibacter sp. H3M3-2]MDF1502446.1 cytochrome c biogenesis protein CcsA [Roseisolibacter sp. H3M3-2]